MQLSSEMCIKHYITGKCTVLEQSAYSWILPTTAKHLPQPLPWHTLQISDHTSLLKMPHIPSENINNFLQKEVTGQGPRGICFWIEQRAQSCRDSQNPFNSWDILSGSSALDKFLTKMHQHNPPSSLLHLMSGPDTASLSLPPNLFQLYTERMVNR